MADTTYTDGPQKCTWHLGTTEKSPHIHTRPKPNKIYNSILEHIGNTPIVRLERLMKKEGLKCELLAKCEYFNAGGSLKDRIGKRMVEDAEKSGRIKAGDILIEPTSGNTGIGLALSAAIKGYRMIITLPEKMSKEKVDILKALGAEIIRTPTEAAWDSPESHIGVARRLNKELPNSHILDQYKNPSNPLAHYDGTAEELVEQCDGKIDYVVVAAGTGGALTGLARKLKEKIPNVKIIGVDPNGSILAQPEELNAEGIHSYFVEGIGYDFIPTVLDRKLCDQWVKSDDDESFTMSRRLIKEEGLLCGGSSGSVVWAALQIAKNLPEGARVVCILPDSIRNYMSKFLDDDWMWEKGFFQSSDEEKAAEPWRTRLVADLHLQSPYTIVPNCTCKNAIAIMAEHGFDQLPVVDEKTGEILGTVTEGNLTSHIVNKRVRPDDEVSKVLYKKFKLVNLNTTLEELSKIFDKEPFALVVATQKCFSSTGVATEKKVITGVATRLDLVRYITTHYPDSSSNTPITPKAH
jgi:cystathionine beta-synthase